VVRTGRRRGEAGAAGTREGIAAAARAVFAERGFAEATIRAVAANARVDPALVHYYFGSKEQLFIAAMELPFDPAVVLPALLAGPREHIGERVVRFFLATWDRPEARHVLMGMMRSAVTDERAAAMLRGFIVREAIGRLVELLGVPDAELRATLVGSQVVGLAFARYIVRVEPLASAETETVVAAVAPTIQRYLTGDVSGSSPRG
jgi:AcrR family transcriptional regulator